MLVGIPVRSKSIRGAWAACGKLALCTAVVLAAGPNARATSLYFDQPVPILLQRPTTTLFFAKELENETRTDGENERKKDFSSDRLSLDFRTNGWIYHPALVTFNLGLTPEFIWRKSESSGGNNRSDKVDFLGYAIETTWLSAKPYTLNLVSRRDRRDTSSLLANDVTTESSFDSANLLLKHPVLPTTLAYSDTDTITEGFFRTQFSQKRWQLDSKMKTQRSATNLRVADMRQERLIKDSTTDSDRFVVALANNYYLNAGGRLNSVLNFADFVAGEQNRTSTTSLRSQLDLPHRENLRSFYSLNLNKNDVQKYSSRSVALQAGVQHKLYENLTTSLNISGGNTAFSDGDIKNYGGNLNFVYTRRIPWGALTMNLGMSERVQDNQVLADFMQVRDESNTFDGISTTIILDNINIDSDSVELTDATGTIIYVRGIDYQVDTLGRSTIIIRDPFAGIGDDTTVLVSYRFEADPQAKTGLRGNSYGMQLSFWDNKFRLYYQGNQMQERLIEGAAPPNLRHENGDRMGAQLNLGWSVTNVEFEDRDSTTTPLKRQTVRQTFSFRPTRNLSFTIGGQLNKTELKDTGEEITARGATAGVGWRVGPGGGQLRAGIFIRENRNIDERGARLNYRWRFGSWFPFVRYEYTNEFNGFANETRRREFIYFEVKRRFR